MFMKPINIKKFRGLAQHIVYEELTPEFCHVINNLDLDDPVGRLSKRGGYAQLETDNFTDTIKAYEYKFPATGEVILILNDNGTLKYYTDGASLTSLTLPSGSAMEANFRNQFFGWKDRILITTGNGATNYVLGFYYIDRENAQNTGLFGNAQELKDSYKLLKAQLIMSNGVYCNIWDAIEYGNFFYVSIAGSKWIEKRDSNWQLVERFESHEDAAAQEYVSLATDDTDIFMGVGDYIYRINPTGWAVEESLQLAGEVVQGIAVDDTYCYVATDTNLRNYPKGNFAGGATSTQAGNWLDVTCDKTGTETHIWAINAGTTKIDRIDKTDMTTTSHSSAVYTENPNRLMFASGSDVFFTEYDLTGTPVFNIIQFDKDDCTTTNTFTHGNIPIGMIDISGGVGLKVISSGDACMVDEATAAIYNTEFVNMTVRQVAAAGSLDAGTYFYKFSIVDTDGQEYTLSDPIYAISPTGSTQHKIRIFANDDQIAAGDSTLFRVQSIKVYRAYSSTVDAEEEATNYKLLKTVDINDSDWTNNATIGMYYYDFTDNITETNIGDSTFEEAAGFSENTKPRFVNYKFHEWLNERLHCANLHVDGDTYKSRIAMSQVNGPDVVPFDEIYDYDPYDGDEIYNISSAYNRIYIMKNRKTGIFYNEKEEKSVDYGIADTDCYLKDGDLLYLMGNKAIIELNGNVPKVIHDPIIDYFESITDFTDGSIFYRDDKGRILFSIPEDRSLVWNRKYNLWFYYDYNYAFKGYFKNISNQYVGYGKGGGSSNNHLWNLNDASQDWTNNIAVSFETSLLKFSEVEGEDIELIKLNYRVHKTGTGSFILYAYDEGSKRTLESFTMEDPASANLAVKTKFFMDDAWGEAFSLALICSATVFQLSGITIFGVPAGETANV
jgi:hypothetical protein